MSRRKQRAERQAGAEPAGGQRPSAEPAGAPPADGGRPPARRSDGRGLAVDLAVLAAVFAVTTGIAELAGAANLGVALGVGQVAFAVVLVVLLARR